MIKKILNLYAGIGGNRILWSDDYDVTAVEFNPAIAKIYKDLFPNDKVIVADAHEFLLKNFKEFDFIWASPPCQSHSRINTDGNQKPRFPDMKLWQEIIFLSNNWFKGKFVVENVIPYYEPVIDPSLKIDRHLFWCNFQVNKISVEKEKSIKHQKGSDTRFGFNLKKYKIENKRQILRNIVNPEIGLHLLNCANGIKAEQEQLDLF